ncbi:MAG: hypothetical protein EP343_26875 [Deltaproteobacteria bacterium]|nr:MAG: hypothetical protein EP343_26875 [Deltaproteobacteria bacterium]
MSQHLKSSGVRTTLAHSYCIVVEGTLGMEWSDWFPSMEVHYDHEGNTILSGVLADQAALHGILKRIRNLGLPLLSIQRE